jgi:acyl-CoA reductase-like NAD-dependent aldehyde dehydrogenase
MTTPTVIEVDCSTGLSVERPMTEAELQAMNERQAEFEAQQAIAAAEAEAKAAAKASAESKLSALGLTADEIAALSN